jgi:hypothetical protein
VTVFSWNTPIGIASALTTDLNSLANAAFSAASTAYDNETNKHLIVDLELHLASLTPTGQPFCAVYALYQMDGTNFDDTPNASDVPIAIFPFSTAVAAKHKLRTNIVIAPYNVKFVVQNVMGPALAASGNTLKFRLHDELGT